MDKGLSAEETDPEKEQSGDELEQKKTNEGKHVSVCLCWCLCVSVYLCGNSRARKETATTRWCPCTNEGANLCISMYPISGERGVHGWNVPGPPKRKDICS